MHVATDDRAMVVAGDFAGSLVIADTIVTAVGNGEPDAFVLKIRR
jgi:hypothetical protein